MYKKIIAVIILLILSIIACFYNLKDQKQEVWDEYTNFLVVYDTIDSDNELILMHGGKPFFEKPPLWYYLAIASTEVFGLNLFALRFVSALSAVLLIMVIFYIGWKMFSFSSGILSGFFMLSTTHLFIPNIAGSFSSHTLRSADLDSLQLLFIMISVFAFYTINNQSNKWFFWTSIASIYTSFAFLTKGPPAFLPALLFFSYKIIQKTLYKNDTPSKNLNWKQIVIIFLVFLGQFLLIISPWYLLMYTRFGYDFFESHFLYHILARSLITIEQHYGKFYYFIRILLDPRFGLLGITTLISLLIVIKKYQWKLFQSFPLYLSVVGVITIFLIISMIQTKLAWYLFYLYPFGALLTGKILNDVIQAYKNSKLLSVLTEL